MLGHITFMRVESGKKIWQESFSRVSMENNIFRFTIRHRGKWGHYLMTNFTKIRTYIIYNENFIL